MNQLTVNRIDLLGVVSNLFASLHFPIFFKLGFKQRKFSGDLLHAKYLFHQYIEQF
jgi:hypothetical protein